MKQGTILLFKWLDGEGIPEFDWDAIEAKTRKDLANQKKYGKAIETCTGLLRDVSTSLPVFLKKKA